MTRRQVTTLVGAAMVAAGLGAIMAGSGSTTHYETREGGHIEFYPNGELKCIWGNATCDGTKVDIAGGVAKIAGAIINRATVVPPAPRVSSNSQGTQPLIVGGQQVQFNPSQQVAMEANAFSPAPAGYTWHGWQSQELLQGYTGPLHTEFTYILDFPEGGYPLPSEVGQHILRVYISDAAGHATPVVQEWVIYGAIPTVSEWGLIVLSVLLVGGGALLILRRG